MSKDIPRSYTDNSAFVRLLETEGRVRILDVLLRRPHSTLSASEISKLAGVNDSTFSRNKGVLESLDIISTTFEDGQAKYQLNTDNDIVSILGNAHTELVRYEPQVLDQTDNDGFGLDELAEYLNAPQNVEELSESTATIARELSPNAGVTDA